MLNMYNEQGVYTISNNYVYDSRLDLDKRCSVQEMPVSEDESTKKTKKPIFVLPKTRKAKMSFSVDLLIILAMIILILMIELGLFPQFYIGFYCKDPKISFPFAGDTISIATLLLSVSLFPLILISAVELSYSKECQSEGCRRAWFWYKEFLLGITVTLVLTEIAKIVIGEPRPHFFDTCKPDTGLNCTTGYVYKYKCTNTQIRQWFVSDSSKSFPSGHSSMSVFTAVFCVWYLQRRVTKMPCKLMKPFLQTMIASASLLCSLSRITDHRHHWWDVLAGVLLGAFCALYTIVVFCHNFKRKPLSQPRASHSTVTLLTDTTNKHATSVVL